MTLWHMFELAVAKEKSCFLHLTQQRAWVGSWDPCQIQVCVESTTLCHFLPLINHIKACILETIPLLWWLKSKGNLRYVIITQKPTARWILWFKQIMLFPSVILEAAATVGWCHCCGKVGCPEDPCLKHGSSHSEVKVAFIKSWAGNIMLHLVLRSAAPARLSWLDYPQYEITQRWYFNFPAVTGDGNWLFTFEVMLME